MCRKARPECRYADLRRLDSKLPAGPWYRPYFRFAGRAHPADLGSCGASEHPDYRRPRRRCCRTHGARAFGTDWATWRRNGHCRTGRDKYRDRHCQRVAGARPSAANRGMYFAAASQYGSATGHSACRYPPPGDSDIARAGEPGPVYVEIPTDVLRTHVAPQLVLNEWLTAKPARRPPPDSAAVKQAVEVFWS